MKTSRLSLMIKLYLHLTHRLKKLRDRTPYVNILHNWLESRKLKLSAEKSSATVFATWNKDCLLVGTGAAQETISVTYKAIGRSFLIYGAAI